MRIRRWFNCLTLGAVGACLVAPARADEEPGGAEEKAAQKPEEKAAQKPEEKPPQKPEEAEEATTDAQPPWPTLRVIGPDMETYFSTKTLGDIIGNPSSISVLRKVEIRGSAARYPSDALRLVPGLEVQRVYSTLSNVAVRGFNDSPTTAQGILCLIDGRQAYNEFLGNPLWDQLMLITEDIEEIEVIRGPGSFLYGPNAMHGLVNFKTRSPLDYTDSEVSAIGAIGSYNSNVAGVRGVKRYKEAGSGLLLNVVYDDIDQFAPPEDDTRDKIYGEVRYEKDLGGGSRDGASKSDHRIEVGAGISDQKFDLLLPTLDLFAGLPPIPSDTYVNQAQELYVTGKYTLGGLVARATWTAFDSSSDSSTAVYAPFDLDLDMVDVDTHCSFRLLDGHELTVGGGYRFATAATADLDVTDGRHSTNLLAAFLQDEVALIPERLSLTAGVRVDYHSEAGSNLAPRAALVWRFQGSHSLRASYGRGQRNPSLLENWLALPLMTPLGMATVAGNENLEAEKMDSLELGYRGWFKEGKLRVGVTGYLNYIDDLVVYEMVAPGTVAPVNQDEYRAYGVEVEGEYGFSDTVSAFGNYSYGILEDRAAGDLIPAAPKNKANLGLRYTSRPENGGPTIDAMAWLTYFGDTEQSFPGGVVDDYVLLNASVSYEFAKGRSAFIKVFNVLDNDHRENPEGDDYGRMLEVGIRIRW